MPSAPCSLEALGQQGRQTANELLTVLLKVLVGAQRFLRRGPAQMESGRGRQGRTKERQRQTNVLSRGAQVPRRRNALRGSKKSGQHVPGQELAGRGLGGEAEAGSHGP